MSKEKAAASETVIQGDFTYLEKLKRKLQADNRKLQEKLVDEERRYGRALDYFRHLKNSL